MLDLLTIRLSGDGVGVARISGDMTRQQRDVNLDTFRRHNSTRVIMISLKAGGEGLNLQNADHIFVVDPWWNPAAELQAIDRVHRIGQTKRVTAIRFIIKDSIEERIVQLQDKKKLVMAGALDGDTSAMQQLTAQVVVTVVFALLSQLSCPSAIIHTLAATAWAYAA
jgi:DNA repair protein RAD16